MLPGCLLKERNVEMHNAMLSSVIFPRRRADFKIFQQLIPLPGDLLSSGSLLASPSPSAIEAARFLSGRALDSFKECGRLMCIGIGESGIERFLAWWVQCWADEVGGINTQYDKVRCIYSNREDGVLQPCCRGNVPVECEEQG
ncbi:hypothetical protein S245_015223 [Arachis hypogaea]